MDIHFCDLCGVRVTDVDLRGGHGIRKHYDVICATCLELGHGKEWLARHQRSKSATVTSQPAHPPAQVTALTPAVANAKAPTVANAKAPAVATPAIIAHARDRIETFEEEDPSPRVAPQVLTAEGTPKHVDFGELHSDDHADVADVADPAHAANAKLEGNEFAAAASSFSALAQPGRVSTVTADVTENAEQGEGLKEESTAAPVLADDHLEHHGFSESPFDFTNGNKKERAAQKDETLPVDGAPKAAAKPASAKAADKAADKATDKAATKKTAGALSTSIIKNAAVGKKSSQANSKSANARSALPKTPARKVNKNKNILMMSALSLGILTMILLITIKVIQNSRKPPQQQTIVFDMSQDLRDAIKNAKVAASSAFKSKDVAQMNLAKIKIEEIRPKIYNFEKETKVKNSTKWNEEDYGRYLEIVDWPNTNLMHKMLSDAILKQRDYK